MMKIKYGIWVLIICFLGGCGEKHRFADFSHSDPYKGEKDFYQDSQVCEAEKNKHSAKIEGRELGFEGQDTAYLGCMQAKGWSRKNP